MSFERSWKGSYGSPDNLVESFETAVARFGANRFLGTRKAGGGYEWASYAELGARVDDFRAALAGLGVGQGEAVGIIAGNRVEWVVAAFAAYGLGARFVPMYEKEQESVWAYIVRDAAIKVLLVSGEATAARARRALAGIESLSRLVVIEDEGPEGFRALEREGASRPIPSIRPRAEDIAVLIYTSGTTGEPKGVLLSHGNCTSCSRAGFHRYRELDQNSVSFSHLPWAHSYGFSAELNNFIQFGGSIALMRGLDSLAEDMASVAPTILISAPRVFNKIHAKIVETMREEGGLKRRLFGAAMIAARERREGGRSGLKYLVLDRLVLSKLRAIFGGRLQMALTASAKMSPAIADFFLDIGIPVYDCYGLTETSPAITMSHATCHRPGSVGKALEDVDIVIDTSMVDDGSGEGEIVVYGPNVMRGYHNKPDKTKAIMTEDGGLRTGDRGRLDEEGFLYITGRFKEEYKLNNGKYVFPAEIEEEMKLLPFVQNAMIYGDGMPFNVALVVPDLPVLHRIAGEHKLSLGPDELLSDARMRDFVSAEIETHLRGRFGGYEIPRRLAFVEEDFTVENGLLTQTLKLKRHLVIERHRPLLRALYAEAAAEVSEIP
ncbi:MAG TPA: AMP-binding protein [Rectinemataceae bacterium]|nr:AMP-binding protein [Rectinemataceae bacterium]